VPLAPLRAVESIVPTIAASLGFTFHGETEPKVQLLDYLRGKDLLLVLDNAEHLIQEPLAGVAGIAAEILKAAPGVEVLVTSRAGLHVQGEHRYPIEGMAYPESAPSAALSAGVCPSPEGETGKLDEAAQYSAIKLFLEAAQRAQPDFQLTDEILPDVVHICQLVEGMPLGILLAAAWVRLLAPAEIAAEIGRSLDFLESDERDVPDRQHSLRAAFDHSWHLLSEREQETFAALSIFRGSFTRDAAQEVTGASPRELLALVDKSLLHRTAEGRYEVHELLQQYAAERLATSPKEEWAIRDRHAAYYAAALERWASDLKSSQQQIALAEMEAEIEDARAAWDWAVEQGQMDRLAQAMEALGWFYDWRVRYLEGASAFRTASEALAAVAKATLRMPDEDLHAWAGVLAWRGLFELRLGQTEHSRECLGHAIDLLKCPLLADQDTRRAKAFLLWATGEAAFWSGDRREAREQYVESLALYRALSDDWGTANALHGLAWIEQSLGAFDNARQFAQDALSLRRALGAARGIAESLRHLGWVFQNLGLFEEAERLERESIALARETNDRPMLAEGLSSLASTLGWQGALAESLSVHEECLALCDDLGDAPLRALTTGLMGYVKAALGQYKEGRRDIERGLVLARETDSKWGTGIFLLFQGMVAATQERYVEAQRCLQESVAVLRASGQRSDVGWSLAALGAVESRLGQADQGRAHVCESLRIALDIRDALTVRFALPFAALLLANLGQVERAVEIHALVSAFPAVANSRMWKDGAGRQITTAAASLPPEVVAAAQERGRARDLWATVEELLVELEEMESESR
jgi:predicted ATPase